MFKSIFCYEFEKMCFIHLKNVRAIDLILMYKFRKHIFFSEKNEVYVLGGQRVVRLYYNMLPFSYTVRISLILSDYSSIYSIPTQVSSKC